MGLIDDIKIQTYAAVASGTTTITQTTGIDMSGFDGCIFVIRLGTPNATNSVKIASCTAVGGTYSDLVNTATGSGGDTPLIIDINRPKEQFLKYIVTRVGAATTIDTICAIQYGARSRPITNVTGTQVEKHISPAAGTA